MNEMQSMESKACPTVSHHETTVSVPVCISPFAVPGPVTIECSGAPQVSNGFDQCCGMIDGGCEFTVSQTMQIDIPIVFGANVHVGDAYIDCGDTSGTVGTDCLCGCTEAQEE